MALAAYSTSLYMQMNKTLLLTYLDLRRSPLEDNEDMLRLHKALCELSPELYLLLLADSASDISHKREILLNLLQQSVAHVLERTQMIKTLSCLPLNEALALLDYLRIQRVNSRRAHDLLLTFLLGHEQFPTLVATRKQYTARLIRHALGERTWSAAKRFLAVSSEEGELFLRRELLRFAPDDNEQTREALRFLAGVPLLSADPLLLKSQAARQDLEQGQGLPRETLLGLRGIYHREIPLKRAISLAAPTENKDRNDGPLTIFYKESLQAFAQKDLSVVEDIGVPLVQSELPSLTGRVGIVLDLSASMLSSGERAYHPAALALSLTRLLQEHVSEVILRRVGAPDSSLVLQPQGSTDLAMALLEVAAQQPELILLLTDGYENQRQGDTAQVVQGLRQLGLTMPIYQVVPLFTQAENLVQRRLGADIPLLPLSHEQGVRELLARVLLTNAEEILSEEAQTRLQALLA